jgi:lipopolysaccharide cholinephosphotransferase
MEEKKCLDIHEMQQIYLELLLEFDVVCKANNLRYDLCGGTLLGAVRHKGFIPWDNDIDVSMPRPDYERFLKLYETHNLELPVNRGVMSYRNKMFPRHFSRYIRYDVKRFSESTEEFDCPYIGIDIFTVDGLPSNNVLFNIQMWIVSQLRRFLLTSVEKKNISRRGWLAAKIKNIYRPLLQKIGCFNFAKWLDLVCQKVNYNDAKYVANINGMYGKKEKWLKKDMLLQQNFEFEGYMFPGYGNYDIYLSNLYGDYMKLPPEKSRVPHCDKGYRVKV